MRARPPLSFVAFLPELLIGGAALAAISLSPQLPVHQDGVLLEAQESPYNNIYVYNVGAYRSLTFGHNKKLYTESLYNPLDDRDLPVAYTRFMTIGLAYAQHADHILEIGFGGGRTAWYLHRFLPNAAVASVELDPAVLALAQKSFGIKDERNFNVTTSDGRLFLKKSDARYDMIMVDAHPGPFVPFHLLTKEFYALAQSRLAEGGVLVQNVEPTTMLFDAAALTIAAVFHHVDIYPVDGNVVMVAYDGEPLTLQALTQRASEAQKVFALRYGLPDMLSVRHIVDVSEYKIIDKDTKILADDFAPVETLKAIQRKNRKWSDQ